ncbi:MAG TPA: glycosyltransferase [Polyangiaceae bacterium]|nr:glycosyltransferase [Polyangiaceae bacterium]
MAADVLYLSFDGVLQPLAFSQVVRVVAGLARRGHRYHVLSLERPADLAQPGLRRAVEAQLLSAGAAWTPLAQGAMGSPRAAARAIIRATERAVAISRRHQIRLAHARGYVSALVARALERLLGVPYVFDARGYWIEERSGPGNWFSGALSYAAGKYVEQKLFRGARAVVTLTELQAADVASGLFGPPPRLLEVIPTCADYDAFYLRESRPTKPPPGGPVPQAVQCRLADKNVIGIVGALNATYLVDETLALARLVLRQAESAHLLVLSNQRQEYESALRSAGIEPDRWTIASATHESMPDWLQWIDWGLLLVPESVANRAKMPTKLAEFFATGVRPVFFGCNSDAGSWVERAGSGITLRSVDGDGLRSAARAIAEQPIDPQRLRAARDATAPHFSLAAGLDRYSRLLEACVAGGPAREWPRAAQAASRRARGAAPRSNGPAAET